MSNLSFMEKLLDGVQVNWKTVDDVFDIFAGGDAPKESLSKVETKEFNIPILSNGIGDNALYGWTDKARIEKPSLTISARGTIGWTSYRDKPFFPIVRLIVLTPKIDLNLKFAYHFMKTIENGYKVPPAGIPQLTKPMLKEIKFPIPCPENPKKSLEIQAEIVRILDAFTAHTAELTAELTARKKQYNYYRDKLLSFEEGGVDWKTLGDEEFFEVGSGGTPSKAKPEYWDGGNIPWIKSESCNNEPVYSANNFITNLGLQKSSAKLLQKETTLIALVGATIFKTAFLEFQATTNQNIANIKSKKTDAINDKFVFYYITNLYEVLKSEMRNYGMLNLTTLRQFKVPVPPLSEQTRIVTILDRFDTLTNSITEGLPREIELRQKQYEHYRDLLLSFPKSNTKVAA